MKKIIEIMGKKYECSPIKNGEGSNATCYLLDNGKVLKVYHNDLSEYNVVYATNFEPLLDVRNNTFIFPEQLFINDEDVVIGYISPFIEGETLLDNPNDILIDEFVDKLDKVYEDISQISERRVFTCEMGPKNIIFNDRFYIIDTDTYFIVNSLPYEVCLSHNISIFNASILDYIVRNEKINQDLFAFINKNQVLRLLWEEMTSRENAKPLLKEFIEELRTSLSDEYGTDIETFNDFYQVFKRVRK